MQWQWNTGSCCVRCSRVSCDVTSRLLDESWSTALPPTPREDLELTSWAEPRFSRRNSPSKRAENKSRTGDDDTFLRWKRSNRAWQTKLTSRNQHRQRPTDKDLTSVLFCCRTRASLLHKALGRVCVSDLAVRFSRVMSCRCRCGPGSGLSCGLKQNSSPLWIWFNNLIIFLGVQTYKKKMQLTLCFVKTLSKPCGSRILEWAHYFVLRVFFKALFCFYLDNYWEITCYQWHQGGKKYKLSEKQAIFAPQKTWIKMVCLIRL